MPDRREIFIFQKEQEERLDHYLVESLPEFSRSRLQGLIKDGFVLVDNLPAKKAGQKIDVKFETTKCAEHVKRFGFCGSIHFS